MKQKKRKAAKAVLSCLVLLLLYGCASHVPGFYGGEADAEGLAADADFSWTEGSTDGVSGASDGSADSAGTAAGASGKSADLAGRAADASGKSADSTDTAVGTLDGLTGSTDMASGAADGSVPGSGAAGGVSSDTIAVYVCGAVKKPGVYELAAGSRVYEAVAMAGGMTKEAAERSVNQAQTLADGQMIVILTEEEAEKSGAEAGVGKSGVQAGAGMAETAESGDGRVNINTAGAQELKTLPGIGDAKAAAIVDYREKNGAFAVAEDLKKVSGIGDSVFAGLEDFIRVD